MSCDGDPIHCSSGNQLIVDLALDEAGLLDDKVVTAYLPAVDERYFSRVFKRVCGCLPQVFRGGQQ